MENVPVLSLVASVFTAAVGLGWFMSRQFASQTSDLRVALDLQRVSLENKIDDHEKVDNMRHEDNLKNFAQVNVSLAKMGSNGWHPRH